MKTLFTLIACIACYALSAQIDECTGYEELYRGRHKINGMTYGHPYTTFDRHDGKTFVETLKSIQLSIQTSKEDGALRVAYSTLFTNAISSRPDANSDNGLYQTFANGDKDHSKLPIWGKNNAFVFLIGLDGFYTPLPLCHNQKLHVCKTE